MTAGDQTKDTAALVTRTSGGQHEEPHATTERHEELQVLRKTVRRETPTVRFPCAAGPSRTRHLRIVLVRSVALKPAACNDVTNKSLRLVSQKLQVFPSTVRPPPSVHAAPLIAHARTQIGGSCASANRMSAIVRRAGTHAHGCCLDEFHDVVVSHSFTSSGTVGEP